MSGSLARYVVFFERCRTLVSRNGVTAMRAMRIAVNLLLALDRLTVVRPSFDLGTVISADYISDNVASLLRQRIDTVN